MARDAETRKRRAIAVTRLTLRAIALPVLRPGRTIAAGLLSFTILLASATFDTNLSPLALVAPGIFAPAALARQIDMMRGWPLDLFIWLGNWLALGFWLCAWQRAVVLGFRTPFRPWRDSWLERSLRRLPSYLLALAVWIALAAALTSVLGLAVRDLKTVWFQDPFNPGDPAAAAKRLAIVPVPFAILLWIFARLSLLPVMVAANGWHRAYRDCVILTRGSVGFRLMPAYLAIFALGRAVAFAGQMAAEAVFGIAHLGALLFAFGLIVLGAGLITQLWLATLAASVAAELAMPSDRIDPAPFD